MSFFFLAQMDTTEDVPQDSATTVAVPATAAAAAAAHTDAGEEEEVFDEEEEEKRFKAKVKAAEHRAATSKSTQQHIDLDKVGPVLPVV